MTHEEYRRHVEDFLAEMGSVTRAKNADYSAGTDDAMDHYYSAAGEAGVTPVQVWFIMLTKHYQAIRAFVKTGRLESESIHGRFIDLANYAMLGDALVRDMNNGGIRLYAEADFTPLGVGQQGKPVDGGGRVGPVEG